MMTRGCSMKRDAQSLVFDLRDAFFVITVIAVFLALRQLAISLEDERVIALGIALVGVATPVYAALKNAQYFFIFLAAAMATFIVSTMWACERIYESPGTSFLREHWISAQYVSDVEINTLAVIVVTIGIGVIGGTLGATLRYLVCQIRSSQTNKKMDRSCE